MIFYDMSGRVFTHEPTYIFYAFDSQYNVFFDWDLWWGDYFFPEIAMQTIMFDWREKWQDDELYMELIQVRPDDLMILWEPVEDIISGNSKVFVEDLTDLDRQMGRRPIWEAFPENHPIAEIYGDTVYEYPQWILHILTSDTDTAEQVYAAWVDGWGKDEADEMWAFLGYHEDVVPPDPDEAFDQKFDEVWSAMGEAIKSEKGAVADTVISMGAEVCDRMDTSPKKLLKAAVDKALTKAAALVPFRGFAKKLLSPKPPTKKDSELLPWRGKNK